MGWLEDRWDWFSSLDVGELAGVAGAVIGGMALLWGIYTHFAKRSANAEVSASRGIAAGRDIHAHDITINESGKTSTKEEKSQ